jgi:hypothetical protein
MVFRVLSLAFVLSAIGARALVIERNATTGKLFSGLH